jgi:hypothetical protein
MATTSPAAEDDRKMVRGAPVAAFSAMSVGTKGRSRRMRNFKKSRSFAGMIAVLVLATGLTTASALAGSAPPRSGDLVVTKECSGFVPTNNPPYCTITSSNLAAIPEGSRILYLNPNGLATATGSAVILDPPGPGNNKAFGTCFLGSNPMHCEFSGGTGMFTWFHASVVVTVTDPGTTTELWHWAGTYSFTPH